MTWQLLRSNLAPWLTWWPVLSPPCAFLPVPAAACLVRVLCEIFGNQMHDAQSWDQCDLPFMCSVLTYYLPGRRAITCRFNTSAKNGRISLFEGRFLRKILCVSDLLVKIRIEWHHETTQQLLRFHPTPSIKLLACFLSPPLDFTGPSCFANIVENFGNFLYDAQT